MSNIGFLENLARRFQPDILGASGQDGNSLPVIAPYPTFSGQPIAAPQLPAINPVQPDRYAGLVPDVAPTAPPMTGLPAIDPTATSSSGYDTQLPAIASDVATRPRVVDNPPLPTIGTAMLAPSAAEKELTAIDAKKYNKGVWKLSDGSTTSDPQKAAADSGAQVVTAPGADRKKNWSTWDKVGSFLSAWAQGGLIPGIAAAADRNYFAKVKDAQDRAKLLPIISNERQRRMQDLTIQNTLEDNQRAREQAANLNQYRQQTLEQKNTQIQNQYNKDQANYKRLLQNEDDRNARSKNKTQTKEVDGYLYRVYPNDPSKSMEPIMDPRTGKQAFNPANVAQEVTFGDGTKAYAKGGQIVQGEYANERQDKQITATAQQGDLNRQAAADRQAKQQQFQQGLETARQQGKEEQYLNKAKDAFKTMYYKSKGKQPTQQEIDDYINNVSQPPADSGSSWWPFSN